MKCFTFLLFLLFVSLANVANGQSPQKKVVFDYDATGNRIMRYFDEDLSAPIPAPPVEDSSTVDTTATEATFTISIYPNPIQTNALITIEPIAGAPDLPFVFDVRIVSTTGGVLYYQQTHYYTAPISINMSAYDVGWYQFFIMRGTEIQQTTLLKQ
jgi:hypothetical protein